MFHVPSRLFHCLFILALSSGTANAGFVVNVSEVGSNVIATGSGTFNTAALTFIELTIGGAYEAFAGPVDGELGIGSTLGGNVSGYYNGILGPTTFGPGGGLSANSESGDIVVFVQALTSSPVGGPLFVLPLGYSGGLLSSQAVWDNQSFDTLGITPGTYTWTWGAGVTADSYTVNFISAVPEPGSLTLMALVLIGVHGIRKRRPLACAGNSRA